jgi:hypothetical protein
MTADRYTATITVEALPDDVPAHVRVKRWLKLALRGFRLRAPAAASLRPAGKMKGVVPEGRGRHQKHATHGVQEVCNNRFG